MSIKANVLRISMRVLLLASLVVPQWAYADWSIGVGIGDHHDDRGFHRDDRRFYRYHDHPHYGYHMHFLPAGYFTVWAGGVRYYYYDGLYYTYVGDGDYVLVNPPIGVYVNAIPPDFQAVNINGRIYYTDNGVYYVLTQHHGYKVVPQPVMYVQPQPIVVAQPVTTVVTTQGPVYAQDSFPINVPNNTGGYTTVVIKKSGNGFMGPQGEFYAQFPSVSQLKAMYVK